MCANVGAILIARDVEINNLWQNVCVGAILIARDVEIKNSWQNEYVGAILIAPTISLQPRMLIFWVFYAEKV